ncbi:MAG: hypothetical protein ISQ76_04020 [Opitutales bacterium]|nr:hypothetical protein [Opitutales bacterium]
MVKIINILLLFQLGLCFTNGQTVKGASPLSSPPRLPSNIPPPPSFASISSKAGKFQIVSAEYYSQDPKPFLYKRLIKYDTTTGEAWVLYSKRDSAGEKRVWVPLTEETKR